MPSDFRKLVQAALFTGCRYAGLARRKCGDFNPDSGTLAIRLSKGKVRHVVLTDDAKEEFEGWTSGRTTAVMIFLRAGGDPWGHFASEAPLEEASAPAGIMPAVNFHIQRHTHGSHLAMNGVPMGVIATQLGHSDTRMTEKHYAYLAPSYVAQAIRRIYQYTTWLTNPKLFLCEGDPRGDTSTQEFAPPRFRTLDAALVLNG
jgi:integrase